MFRHAGAIIGDISQKGSHLPQDQPTVDESDTRALFPAVGPGSYPYEQGSLSFRLGTDETSPLTEKGAR